MLWHSQAPGTKEWAEIMALRAAYLTDHESELTAAQVVDGACSGLCMVLALGLAAGQPSGYVLAHRAEWQGAACLHIDEVYVSPEARGQGLFAEVVQWIQHYRAVTGTQQVFTVARTRDEYAPWEHVGATAVAMSLSLSQVQSPKSKVQSQAGTGDSHVMPGGHPSRNGISPLPRESAGAAEQQAPARTRHSQSAPGHKSERRVRDRTRGTAGSAAAPSAGGAGGPG